MKVRATQERREGGMSRTWIGGPSKWRQVNVPFGPKVPFIGFDWDLEAKTVSLQKK